MLRMLRDNRATVVAGLLLVLLIGSAAWWMRQRQAVGGRLVALVHDAQGEVHELPLDTDDTLSLSSELGSNTIEVRDGAVFMAQADCENGICLQHHPLTGPGEQIICLPHEVWIEVVAEGESGGTMDTSLAQEDETDDSLDVVAR